MRALILGLLLVLGCSSESTNAGLWASDASGEGDAGEAADGADGADAGEADAEAEACALVQHFNGYNTFVDCLEVGNYNEALALDACASYFGVNCQVLTNPNICGGANLAGYKSDAWIVWTWSQSTGTTRLSWTNTPECPTAADQVWW